MKCDTPHCKILYTLEGKITCSSGFNSRSLECCFKLSFCPGQHSSLDEGGFLMRSGALPRHLCLILLAAAQIAKQSDQDQLDLAIRNCYLYENEMNFLQEKERCHPLAWRNFILFRSVTARLNVIPCNFSMNHRPKNNFRIEVRYICDTVRQNMSGLEIN